MATNSKSKNAKKSSAVSETVEGTGKGWPSKRTFPSVSLEEALKVAQAIRVKNGGNPMATSLVATACNTTARSQSFFYLASAAQNYGLTVGSRRSKHVQLTPFGRSVVYASTPDEEREKKIEAFFAVEKFRQVYDHYDGSSNLPEQQYLSNTLENQFSLPPADHAEFENVFRTNCVYLGIERGLGVPRSQNSEKKLTDVRSVGRPSGQFERTAFVAMPFSEKGKQLRPSGFFSEVLKSVITPAANAAGFAVETARREDSDIIHHTIIRELMNADLVIADLTDHNPNVLFELGIRMANKKPVVIIKSHDTGPVFDVDNMLRVYMYDQNVWPSSVQADVKGLTDRIVGTWENRDQSVGYMQILTTGQQPVG